MDISRIEQALENGLVSTISKGDTFKLEYQNKIDVSRELQIAYNKVDYDKVYANVTTLLEEKLAEKIVNKIVTEMGTDMKKLMCNPVIRDDFRFFLRSGIEKILSQAANVKGE